MALDTNQLWSAMLRQPNMTVTKKRTNPMNTIALASEPEVQKWVATWGSEHDALRVVIARLILVCETHQSALDAEFLRGAEAMQSEALRPIKGALCEIFDTLYTEGEADRDLQGMADGLKFAKRKLMGCSVAVLLATHRAQALPATEEE